MDVNDNFAPTLKDIVLSQLFAAQEELVAAKKVPETRLKRGISVLWAGGIGTGITGSTGIVTSALAGTAITPLVLLAALGVGLVLWGNHEADLSEREIEKINQKLRAIEETRRVLIG